MAVAVSRLVVGRGTATKLGALGNIADQTRNFASSSPSSPECPYTRQKFSTEAVASGTPSSTIDHASAKPFNKLPGDWKSRFPIISALPIFLPYINKPENGGGMRVEDFMRDYYEKYGKQYGVCQFGAKPQRTALVFDEGFLEVYKNEGKYPSGILTGLWPIEHFNRLNNIDLKNPFLAKGGKAEGGETWRKGRMSLNPHIFNLQTAKTYLPAINQAANTAANCFEDYATTGRLDVFCERAAFDMFSAAGLGLQVASVRDDEDGLRLMEAINGGFSKGSHIATACPWLQIDMFKFGEWKAFESKWRGGREAGKELVRKALENGEGSGTGIVHGFFDDPNLKISNEEAIEMFLVLTFAAADTTSSLVNNVLTNLARNIDVQDKVRAEFQAALNGDDYGANVKLPYFEQVRIAENSIIDLSMFSFFNFDYDLNHAVSCIHFSLTLWLKIGSERDSKTYPLLRIHECQV